MTVRVRIAPSPTGLLHVGNTRSALFNWLFARHHGGTFILRIDDTDTARSEPQFEDDIREGMSWLGLDWDEGLDVGGPHGTYRQSDRFERYRDVTQRLIESGYAYFDDRTSEQLDALRSTAQKEGKHPNFYIRRPTTPATEGVVRFSVPQDKAVEFADIVRGAMRFEAGVIDDFVILRSDGSPTYHLASTVDDVDYEISHVVRGEDLLSSTPKHILITEAMGAETARYAHLPLLFGPDGKKLSKRHGDTSLRAYREGGYLPEALFNYLSLLGWSYEAETTIFSRDQAVSRFDLSGVSRNPAVFDTDKLLWMNGEYIRAIEVDDFLARIKPHFGDDVSEVDWNSVVELGPEIQERVKLLPEAAEMAAFLFGDQVKFDDKSWSKVMRGDHLPGSLTAARNRLEDLEVWDTPSIEVTLREMLEELGLNARKGLQPLRVAISGSQVSPPLFESMKVLGRQRVVDRIKAAEERFADGSLGELESDR